MLSNKYFSWLYILLIGILCCSLSISIYAQDENKQTVTQGNTSVREEIQRYMGYEELPARYLSLPYDVTMNTNVRGPFIDIGFCFLLLIPIFYLMGYLKRPKVGIPFMLFCVSIFIISIANSFILSTEPPYLLDTKEKIATYVNEISLIDAPIDFITAHVHLTARTLYQPLNNLFKTISGNYDYFTYPMLIILFVIGFWLVVDRIKSHTKEVKAIVVFAYIFGFFWLILTSGIIWYGYLILVFSTLFVVYPLSKQLEPSNTKIVKVIKYSAWSILFISIFLLLNFKSMNYQPVQEGTAPEKMLFDPVLTQYRLGVVTKEQTLNQYYPGIDDVLDKINEEDQSLVYRVGTIFPFFIRKNDSRVLLDNQLGVFNTIQNQLSDRVQIAEALKASNFKYILVDLNTYLIDKTPEKTLTKKFLAFMNDFIARNPKIELLATDRQVLNPQTNEVARKVFLNTQLNEQAVGRGTFAIYEIK